MSKEPLRPPVVEVRKAPGFLRGAVYTAVILILSFGLAAAGHANSDGMIGASGQNQGFFCRNCHVGGTFPEVAFGGPMAVEPGAIATFTFTVISNSAGQTVAGLNVSADGGTLGLVDGQGTRLELGEITHTMPRVNDANNEAIFELTWQAPASPGVYTLYGAGTSANDDALRTGDRARATTYEVFVGVATPTSMPQPTPTATATSPIGDCVGDCNGDGSVTVDEVVTGVNIALGITAVSSCPAFDANGDQTVTVDEILQATNNALNGCPA